MTLLVATDLHGSKGSAQRVLDWAQHFNAEKIVLLGDLYYHGPRNGLPCDYDPMAVATLLNGVTDKLQVVKGNCDSEVDEMISSFAFCERIEINVNGFNCLFTHGHRLNKYNLPPMGSCDVLFHGHTHVNQIDVYGDVVVVNVGSPSFPKDGIPSFCLVEDNLVTLRNLNTGEVVASVTLK